ncbi:50S ribosomal protein L33 [Mycoplasma sp. 2045]|nr:MULTISPECIES: 50S ribosomal protein L33 [unclassified Mycoplasma]MEA4162723.1 50S ribosomal protein L33 [Mycoplasma sp. 4404]MEA4276290.1 50S ribosomal protein L33 [Mycoplasma sp. 21DD0573]MEA4333761.1 50S ribosomal protein L33 [Mycoplasma sp. 1232]UUM20554.1 50S ribosomal protein L33 [Mycoplasma sp. 2045]
MKSNKVSIACELCRKKNYVTIKSAGNAERLAIKKYCPHCKQHSIHKEEV